jgi:hypothetical protein
MFNSIHFEVFSAGMKAKLSPTYRRNLELSRREDHVETGKDSVQDSQTILPFTTKTKAYGTYVWRKR